jgi:hypothetical protein
MRSSCLSPTAKGRVAEATGATNTPERGSEDLPPVDDMEIDELKS